MSAPAGDVPALGPPALPHIGHVRAFLRDKLGFLSRCASEYGDVVKLEIGGRTYLLSGPDDIKHVLVSNSDNYEKTSRLISSRARRFFGDGLVTAVGPAHLRQRRMLQPLFHRAVVERFATLIVDGAEEMLDSWTIGAVVDVHQAMLDLTQRIMLRALLGDVPPSELDRFAYAVSARRRYQEYLLGSTLPFASLVPNRAQREHARADREIDAIVGSAVRRRRAASARAADMLAMLVHAKYEDGTTMSDEQIRDEARTLAVAGYETVAEALTWTWYLLATSPSAESAVAVEAGAIPEDRPLGVADLATLPYCRMVLAESMRLYPPTWLFVRVAQNSDVLPSGVRIAAGSKIYLSQWVIHRNPRYFPDPDRFDPQRFTDEAITARPRFTYLPFGTGRRLCIGEEFAWMQGMLLMASIARRFRLLLVPGQSIAPEPNVTMRPRNGIWIQVARR